MPRCGGIASGSVLTRVATTVECAPFVAHIFVPLMTYSPSSSTAPCLDRLHIGAAVRLAHREAAVEFTGRHARQEALALFVGAELLDQEADDEVGVDDAGDRHPAPGDLLAHHRVGRVVETGAAVRLGHREAEEPELLHLRDDPLGVGVVVLQVVRDRDDLPLDEIADHADDLALLGGHIDGHGTSLAVRPVRPRGCAPARPAAMAAPGPVRCRTRFRAAAG